MGTVHRESRNRLETLRMCDAITDDEWLCMTRALQSLDRSFTARCKSASVPYTEIADDQRRRYETCAGTTTSATIECGLLSTDPACVAVRCAPEAG